MSTSPPCHEYNDSNFIFVKAWLTHAAYEFLEVILSPNAAEPFIFDTPEVICPLVSVA